MADNNNDKNVNTVHNTGGNLKSINSAAQSADQNI